MNEYPYGQQVRISGAFTDDDGEAADPASGAVVVKYKDPSGNVTMLTYPDDGALVKDSTGNYHVDLLPDEAGDWLYEFAGTSVLVVADWKRFRVQADMVS